jgi:hypothetical protein
MNKLKRQSIADSINRAKNRCGDAFDSYRPYQPTLDHEAALRHLDEAQRFLDEAREKILQVHQPDSSTQPQLNKPDVSGSLPPFRECSDCGTKFSSFGRCPECNTMG